ncbi:MAG: PAS domain-containing protein [Hyphomicrobiales bacterium]|nr:PAS domain-containing protein [Hyphomicrobiales bacterium]
MKHQSSRQLYAYWARLRGDRIAPQRSEIDPNEIRQILGNTFILEAAAPDSYVYRLAGTRICSAYCRELKGHDFLPLWSGSDRESIATLLKAVHVDGAIAVIGFSGYTERNQEISFELTLMPLCHDGREINRILGSQSMAETPFWIGIHPIVRHEIHSLRLIWPDETPHFLRKGEPIADIEAPPVVNPHARRRHGHLLVFDGGKS